MDEDRAYRAMNLLVGIDVQPEVQEAVFFAVPDLLNLDVNVLFFDTTSISAVGRSCNGRSCACRGLWCC